MTSPAWLSDVATDRLCDQDDAESWQVALSRVQDALSATALDIPTDHDDRLVLEARAEIVRAAAGIGNARARLLMAGKLILSQS